MSDIAVKIENISKQYRLGVVGTGTLSHDINRWWARIRGKDDPSLKIGQENTLAKAGGDYVWALKDINLEIKKGEVLGIIGKNGAGKSTLLKILSRVTGPTTGSIKVNGRLASLLEVGTGFHPELTGKENIFLNGAILGMSKQEIKKKLDEIVEFAGVAKYLNTPVKRYSSGMYVRLAFAVAAHLDSEILVVDEVLAVGDAEFQKKAIGKMQDVSSQGGRTVLFVSHNMASVKALCNRGVLLENGIISLYNNIEMVVSAYLNKNYEKKEIIHLTGSLDVKIKKVSIDNDTEVVVSIYEKKTCMIELSFKDVAIGCQKLEFFYIIYDENNTPIVSSFQRDTISLFEVQKLKSSNKVYVELFMDFKPGNYRVSFGIFDENKNFVDWADNCLFIKIETRFVNNNKFDDRLGLLFKKNNFFLYETLNKKNTP
ncbi:MAG: ATP-binding cassette domain-containing protein [Bacteroidales bacterium]|nr:ATP-binding cassette domain-containing protein [Bacteroidales bacterium]